MCRTDWALGGARLSHARASWRVESRFRTRSRVMDRVRFVAGSRCFESCYPVVWLDSHGLVEVEQSIADSDHGHEKGVDKQL